MLRRQSWRSRRWAGGGGGGGGTPTPYFDLKKLWQTLHNGVGVPSTSMTDLWADMQNKRRIFIERTYTHSPWEIEFSLIVFGSAFIFVKAKFQGILIRMKLCILLGRQQRVVRSNKRGTYIFWPQRVLQVDRAFIYISSTLMEKSCMSYYKKETTLSCFSPMNQWFILRKCNYATDSAL